MLSRCFGFTFGEFECRPSSWLNQLFQLCRFTFSKDNITTLRVFPPSLFLCSCCLPKTCGCLLLKGPFKDKLVPLYGSCDCLNSCPCVGSNHGSFSVKCDLLPGQTSSKIRRVSFLLGHGPICINTSVVFPLTMKHRVTVWLDQPCLGRQLGWTPGFQRKINKCHCAANII